MSDFEAADTVRAMLGNKELPIEKINAAATKLGWPQRDPHPFLVAEVIEKGR